MNNLVAYDADSDDESPRRRSSEAANLAQQARRRRTSDAFDDLPQSGQSESSDSESVQNFAEPPPPKRITEHSPSPAAFPTPLTAIPHASSTASLVSYSGEQDEEDGENQENPGEKPEEPAPPAREQDESDEEQHMIDRAIQEGNEAMNRMNEEFSPSNDGSGRSSPNGERIPVEEERAEFEVRIPPAPEIEVNPAIAARFEHAFRQKAGGTDLNRQIQGNQQYNNPMSYDTFIEAFDIDEKGTNFAANIFDPHCFPDNCFYDAIGEEQRKLSDPPKKK